MATSKYNRWHDDQLGDDPVDRVVTSSVPSLVGDVKIEVPSIPSILDETDTVIVKRVAEKAREYSLDSGIAPFDTLFDQYDIEARPQYNFWERDEEKTAEEREMRDPAELPRYVKLSWNQAPDVPDPKEFQRRALSGKVAGARDQFTQLSPFGFGSHAIVGALVAGEQVTPTSLKPESFKDNCLKSSNGHMCAGMVEAVVSVPVGFVTPPPKPDPKIIDEDEFLANSQKWWGISYAEANAALARLRSSVCGAQALLARDGTAASADALAGKFGLRSSADSHDVTGASGGSPAVSFSGLAGESSRTKPQKRVQELLGQAIPELSKLREYHSVRVKLIHTDCPGLVTEKRVNGMGLPHHADSLVALAQHAVDLSIYADAGVQQHVRDPKLPSDVVPDVVRPVEYVGYIIEKWELIDGAFKLVDTYYIPGREYTDYYDSAVKYGATYRYRIRGVLRWSRPKGVGPLGPYHARELQSSINTLTPNEVSYFCTSWNGDWAYAQVIDSSAPDAPDELTARPVSAPDSTGGPSVHVSFRLPANPQRDINKMVLYRKLQGDDGRDITGWVQVREFVENLSDPTRQGTRRVYSAVMEHQQDDITGTKFFTTESDSMEDFVEYGPSNALYVDHDVRYWGRENSYRYVYAAACFTRHGERSPLSDQIAVRLNPEWKRDGELPAEFVSLAGVDIDFDSGPFSTYPETRTRSEVTFGPADGSRRAGIAVMAQERVAGSVLVPSSYVMRVESLDTGEKVDVPVTISVKNLPEEVRVVSIAPLVIVGAFDSRATVGVKDSRNRKRPPPPRRYT